MRMKWLKFDPEASTTSTTTPSGSCHGNSYLNLASSLTVRWIHCPFNRSMRRGAPHGLAKGMCSQKGGGKIELSMHEEGGSSKPMDERDAGQTHRTSVILLAPGCVRPRLGVG